MVWPAVHMIGWAQQLPFRLASMGPGQTVRVFYGGFQGRSFRRCPLRIVIPHRFFFNTFVLFSCIPAIVHNPPPPQRRVASGADSIYHH